jgi:exopolyphosphatase/guanosine-5'-triphosphate,3'-diphosphate pyrophosphatase
VSQLLVAAGRSADGSITRADVAWAIGRCIAAGRIDRIDLPGLKADRRPVIAGGLAILSAAMAQFGIESLRPTAGALRHGVIFELHDRSGGGEQAAAIDELRERSVADLQRRFEVDPAQAVRVRRVALALFAQVLPDAEADPRQELGWAAALHEVGLIVSHHDHHRHSAYLVGKADAAGFSQSEQRRLAALVLGQRGGLRKVEALLTQPAGALALLCLRLAVIICHPRADPDAGALRLRLRGSGAVEIRLDTAWARAHPRTRYLLGEEAAAWDRAGALRLQLAE